MELDCKKEEEKKVLVTVDTEGHDGIDPVRHLIIGDTGKGLFGIDRIMDICDEYNIKAIFFVDIAEAWDYGEEKIVGVMQSIVDRGHTAGVHIHPDHMADPKRKFLWQYTAEEQKDIIEKCTKKYTKIMGYRPTIFRAGKYGADRTTIDLLCEQGYKYDFSEFYGQKWCHIHPEICYTKPTKYNTLIEIPVSTFESLNTGIGAIKRYDKIDAVMGQNQYKYIMKRVGKSKGYDVVSLFFHSFSLLDWRYQPDDPQYNEEYEKKFRNAIEYVIDSNIFNFISPHDLQELYNDADPKLNCDKQRYMVSLKYNPIYEVFFNLECAWRIRHENKRARYTIFITMILSIALLLSILFFIIRI